MPESFNVSSRGAFSHIWNKCSDNNVSYAVKIKLSIVAFVKALFCGCTVYTTEVGEAFLENGTHENSIFGKEYRKFQSMKIESVKEEEVKEEEVKEEEVKEEEVKEEEVKGKINANAESDDSYEQGFEEDEENNLIEESSRVRVAKALATEIESAMCAENFSIHDNCFLVGSIKSLEPEDCLRLLKKACELEHRELAIRFLSSQKKCVKSDDDKKTVLLLFVRHNIERGVEQLLKNDTTNAVNCEDPERGDTPLAIAASSGYFKCLKTLLKYGAEAKVCNRNGATPLQCAAEGGHIECLKLLLESGAKDDVNRLDSRGFTALCRAALKGHTECVKELLNVEGVWVNRMGGTIGPLALAVLKGHLDCVKELLKIKVVDVNEKGADGKTPLYTAIDMKGLACFLELLGDDRTNINDQDTYYQRTPLHRCIEWSLKDFVHALLAKQGINVNAVDSGGLTPLHCAVQEDNVDLLKALLVKQNIARNERERDGNTPLQYAMVCGSEDSMMVLLREKDIQLNVMNKNNDTLLHSIAEWGKEKGIKELFKVVPDIIKSVNDKNKEGNTPLHCVAIKGNKNALTEFLEIEGIGVNEKNNQGKTPLECAEEGDRTRHKECAEMLRERVGNKGLL